MYLFLLDKSLSVAKAFLTVVLAGKSLCQPRSTMVTSSSVLATNFIVYHDKSLRVSIAKEISFSWTSFTWVLLGLFCFSTSLYVIRTYWRLRHFPGPSVARFTDLGRLWWAKTSRSHHYHMDFHKRYGQYVRLGPNMISISDPGAIALVYPIRPGLPKV
jgi:hypothetical protein